MKFMACTEKYIYCIENKLNGKKYVGKTDLSVEARLALHLREYKKHRVEQRPLYAAMRKYGPENFQVTTLEVVIDVNLDEREIYWIQKLDTYRNGYNATLGGTMRGYYAGRFNDLCAISLQAELRQQIFKRFGAVAWGGAGNVFHNFRTFAWSETLPTYGVGLRFELKKGVNLRLDYGFGSRDQRGKLIHGAVFAINEEF
jgi:hypothetical protein